MNFRKIIYHVKFGQAFDIFSGVGFWWIPQNCLEKPVNPFLELYAIYYNIKSRKNTFVVCETKQWIWNFPTN